MQVVRLLGQVTWAALCRRDALSMTWRTAFARLRALEADGAEKFDKVPVALAAFRLRAAATGHAGAPPGPEAGLGRRACGEVSSIFDEVSPRLVHRSDWKACVCGRWKDSENILRLEGRALILGLRHRLRSQCAAGRRQVFLSDNLSLVLALMRGRASSPQLLPVCRAAFAHSMFPDVHVSVRWVASEFNPADAASRAGASGASPGHGRAPQRCAKGPGMRGKLGTSLEAAIDKEAADRATAGAPRSHAGRKAARPRCSLLCRAPGRR